MTDSGTLYRPNGPSDFAEWADVVCRTYVQVSCDPLEGVGFKAHLTSRAFGIAMLSDVGSTPARYQRTAHDLRRAPSDDMQLLVMREGEAFITQAERSTRLRPGDMALYDATRQFELQFQQSYRATTLKISRQQLVDRLPAASNLTALALGANTALGSMIGTMVHQCAAFPDQAAAHAMRLSTSLLDMVGVAFEAELASDTHQLSRHRGLLDRVRQTMREHIPNPDFDLGQVCRKHGLSPRTLNRLFASEGTTAMRWLWQQRLEESRRALIERRARNVTEAALSTGFNDLSHYTRSFKQAFGILPSSLQRTH